MENTNSPLAGATKSSRGGLFSWRTLRRCLLGGAILITLVAILVVEEGWRGKRALENYNNALLAKGEKLDFKDFIPPPVPDDQNFAMTPFLAPLFDFNPIPLKAGQSAWRDTNAFQRTHLFTDELKIPSSSEKRPGPPMADHMTDLSAWVPVLEGHKEAKNETRPSPERTEAATRILKALKEKYGPVLDELETASHRPFARFNIQYDYDDALAILLPHLAVIKGAATVFQIRASAELALGQTSKALADIHAILALSKSVEKEPFLISHLVQVAITGVAVKPVWEGLNERKWSDKELQNIMEEFEKINLLEDCSLALRGERAMSLHWIEQLRVQKRIVSGLNNSGSGSEPGMVSRLVPAAWIYQNELTLSRMYQDLLITGIDGNTRRVLPHIMMTNDARMNEELKTSIPFYNIFARILLPAVTKAKMKAAAAQERVDEARIACALERYRLANGQFPETLDALRPRFIDQMPADIITGSPLIYRRTTDGQFVLYSVGWNEKDDGGTVAMNRGTSPSVDITQGDWVWQYPAR